MVAHPVVLHFVDGSVHLQRQLHISALLHSCVCYASMQQHPASRARVPQPASHKAPQDLLAVLRVEDDVVT